MWGSLPSSYSPRAAALSDPIICLNKPFFYGQERAPVSGVMFQCPLLVQQRRISIRGAAFQRPFTSESWIIVFQVEKQPEFCLKVCGCEGRYWRVMSDSFGRISSELISSNNDRYIWIKSMFRFKRNTVEMLLYFLSTNCLQIIKYYWCFGQWWLDFVIFKNAIPLNLLKYLVSDVCSKQNIDIDCYYFMSCLLMFHSLETFVTSV